MIKYLVIAQLTNEGEPASITIESDTPIDEHDAVLHIVDLKNGILQKYRATQINIIDMKEL
ncbi:hypothetical protein OB952_21275 [Aeromonas salmonicida]|uniref:hypothetical protein n=1 Tax=Aeromonas salmonicida TaxID=645 RepID=UPI00259F651A|nr:hypothetical protein [Aeromonas salmonicida]MDM5069859.1 hypothetical protein [Aeromonas salmonicida]MDM5069869.1 hypothetical protein [Aeromonas salmonicida]